MPKQKTHTPFIIEEALRLGACDLVRSCQSTGELLELLFTPQGLEFAGEKGFPTADILRRAYKYPSHKHIARLYIGTATRASETHILGDRSIIIGDSRTLSFRAEHPEFVHRIILIEGATLSIRLGDYCIAKVTQVGRKSEIINLTPPENANARLIID